MRTKLIILFTYCFCAVKLLCAFEAEVDYIARALLDRGSRFARTLSGSYPNLFLRDQQDHVPII